MHWSTSDVLRSPLYSSTMARNRFTAILRFLHLANNQAEDKFPLTNFSKFVLILDIVLPSFLRIYISLPSLSSLSSLSTPSPPPPPLQCWTHCQPNSTLKREEGEGEREGKGKGRGRGGKRGKGGGGVALHL